MQFYQREDEKTKKNNFINHELELYQKIAWINYKFCLLISIRTKSGHHLLRASFQVKQEDVETNLLNTDTYSTSFNRVDNGLRILR